MSRILPVLLLAAALAACGQKGPLYMPAKAPVQPTADAAALVAPVTTGQGATAEPEKKDETKKEKTAVAPASAPAAQP